MRLLRRADRWRHASAVSILVCPVRAPREHGWVSMDADLRGGARRALPVSSADGETMTLDPYAAWEKLLPDGRLVTVDPMTFGKFRLHITAAGNVGQFYDDGW